MTWEECKAVYDALYKADPDIKSLVDKMVSSSISYDDANRYAIRIGETLSKTMWNTGALSGITEEDAVRSILDPALRNNYELASQASALAQQAVNDEAGIGIKAVTPTLKEDRINGLVGEIVSKGYDEIVQSFEDQLVNFSQSAVDDTVQSNAWLHAKAGLSPKIMRKAESGACRWCRNQAGTYDYAEVKDTGNDVFRRHENCRCTVEYIADREKKTVWNKDTLSKSQRKQAEIEGTVAKRSRSKGGTSLSSLGNDKLLQSGDVAQGQINAIQSYIDSHKGEAGLNEKYKQIYALSKRVEAINRVLIARGSDKII